MLKVEIRGGGKGGDKTWSLEKSGQTRKQFRNTGGIAKKKGGSFPLNYQKGREMGGEGERR